MFCGCVALVFISRGELAIGSLLVLLGAFFDFFDGMAARLLKVGSPMGAELDSLADVVTFGVVPAYISFQLLRSSTDWNYIPYIAFVIAIFSALRLAKFNVDDRQTDSFIGLPTPANALFWISIPLMQWQGLNFESVIDISSIELFFLKPTVILISTFVFSILLVVELPLLSLKFKSLSWKGNQNRFLLLIFSLPLIALFYFAAIPFILLLYLILSLIENRSASHEIQS